MYEEKTSTKQMRENKTSKVQWRVGLLLWLIYVVTQILTSSKLIKFAFIWENVIFTLIALIGFLKLGLPMTKAAVKDFNHAVRPEGQLKSSDKNWFIKYFLVSLTVSAIFVIGVSWLRWG